LGDRASCGILDAWIHTVQIAITILNLLGIALILTSVNGGGLGIETNPPLFSIE
jgi:hypothetical protein